MSKMIPSVIILIFVFCGQTYGQSTGCSKETWRIIAELYAFAVCYPDQFPDYVSQNKALYPAGGSWQKCGERLGATLLGMAKPLSERRENEERAYDIASTVGAGELAGQVADSLNADSGSPAMLGLNLLAVIKSTLEIERGVPDGYAASDFYKNMAELWAALGLASTPEEMNEYRTQVHDLLVANIVESAPSIIR